MPKERRRVIVPQVMSGLLFATEKRKRMAGERVIEWKELQKRTVGLVKASNRATKKSLRSRRLS
jgi:hypothetical protein